MAVDFSFVCYAIVVTKDIPSGVIAVGNPCRVMREITEQDKYKYKMAE